jgi:hypothetical protein
MWKNKEKKNNSVKKHYGLQAIIWHGAKKKKKKNKM